MRLLPAPLTTVMNSYTFNMSDEEAAEAAKWVKNQREAPRGTIGGQFTYSFTPTSLGVIVRVIDNHSGKIEDVMDYLSW